MKNRSPRPWRIAALAAMLALVAVHAHAAEAVVDLKQDFVNLAANQYFVRVGIESDKPSVRLVCDGEFVLHDQAGRILYTGKGKEPVGFTNKGATPGKTVYYYFLATFAEEERTPAEAFARRARQRLGTDVAVMSDPRVEVAPSPFGDPPAEPPRLVAAAGPFQSREEARKRERSIFAAYKAELYQTEESRATGRVRAIGKDNLVLAEAEGYIGMRPRAQRSRIWANGIRSLYAGWDRPGAWGDNLSYRGLMEIWVNPRGGLSIVNRVFIEHYLYGVVPPETGSGAPFEMKKVQAIISRSIAIYHLRLNRHAGWHFDLCNTQHCQVYKGIGAEDAETNSAIDATRGQVLVYDNHIINAVYSQCCGGVTAASDHIWKGDPVPYLQSRFDSVSYPGKPNLGRYEEAEKWINDRPPVHCNPDQKGCPHYLRESFRWKRTYTAEQLRQNIHRMRKTYGPVEEKVTNLRVLERSPSGRILSILVDTGKRTIRINGAQDVRQALGSYGSWLPSAFFVFDRTFDTKGNLTRVVIKGAGMGHGVGLCQTGAYMLACQGTNYVTILKHYYTGADVYKIYE